MFIVSELTGNIYKDSVKIELDVNNLEFQEYLKSEDVTRVEFLDFELEELREIERQKKITVLRKLYRDKIDELVGESFQKERFEQIPIPQHIKDERQRLKEEYHTLISNL